MERTKEDIGQNKMAKLKRLLTPQQELFLSLYCNPKSETFGNAYASAVKSKYNKKYAENITGQLPDWLSENLGDLKRLRKAEKVLDETLDMDTKNRKIINEEIIETEEPSMLKIKQDTAKFVASGVGKHKYGTRTDTDLTTGGKPIGHLLDNLEK